MNTFSEEETYDMGKDLQFLYLYENLFQDVKDMTVVVPPRVPYGHKMYKDQNGKKTLFKPRQCLLVNPEPKYAIDPQVGLRRFWCRDEIWGEMGTQEETCGHDNRDTDAAQAAAARSERAPTIV